MKILLSGITGQDGSYLSEHLLNLGHEVHGIIRRSSSFNTERIEHLYKDPHLPTNLFLHYGDISDGTRISELVQKIQPDHIYHLAAMSHVKVSFDEPAYSVQTNILGTLNFLEAIRHYSPNSKFYHASSSEQFGKVQEIPQKETTTFYPRSPYACSKVYSHYQTINYRESYNIFACNGILFNHESICGNSPIIIKTQGLIDILPIEDMFKSEKHRYEGILNQYKDSEVWNGSEWTKIKNGTCYQDKNKKTRIIQTRETSCETTFEHYIFKEDNTDIANEKLVIGDKLYKTVYPENFETLFMDTDFAKFIGFISGDGHITKDGYIRLTGKDIKQLEYYASLVTLKYGWTTRISEYISGFGSAIFQLDINNDSDWGQWVRSHLYTKYNDEKRVPKFILNGSASTKKAFFEGYYDADGRKAGHEKYKIKGFTTSSATLCLGLIYLLKSFSSQSVKCKCEYRDNKRYFYVQLGTPYISNKGKHLIKAKNEIISITEAKSTDGWYFDIQTESETFATGPNLCKIHNSPRRGETFVTKKITKAAARIKLGLQNKLYLGNLDAKRDWGHAKDYTKAMFLMLNHHTADDYVIATGETHSVREFLEKTFSYHNLNWQDYVQIDPQYFRPAEVDLLIGDSTKAKTILKWQPEYTFDKLVEEMAQADYEYEKKNANK